MIVTGIGSRRCPQSICELFTEIGGEVRERGWYLRSGHALGSDYAFELGSKERCIVYLPWEGFNKEQPILGIPRVSLLRDEVLKMVYLFEPYAKDLSNGVKRIKSRNIFQVLGEDLETPSDVVICWTEGGIVEGGTGLAINVAMANGIPIVNVGDPNTSLHLDEIIQEIIEGVENGV